MLTPLCSSSLTRAFDARVLQALGANGIVNARFVTTTTMNRLIIGLHVSVLVYGTVSVTVRCRRRCCACAMHESCLPVPFYGPDATTCP